jgi:hypothetical protein
MPSLKNKLTEPANTPVETTKTKPGKVLSWVLSELRQLALPDPVEHEHHRFQALPLDDADPILKFLVGKGKLPGELSYSLPPAGPCTAEMMGEVGRRVPWKPETLTALRELDARQKHLWAENSRIAGMSGVELYAKAQGEAEARVASGEAADAVATPSRAECESKRQEQIRLIRRQLTAASIEAWTLLRERNEALLRAACDTIREALGQERAWCKRWGLKHELSPLLLSLRSVAAKAHKLSTEPPADLAWVADLSFGYEEAE